MIASKSSSASKSFGRVFGMRDLGFFAPCARKEMSRIPNQFMGDGLPCFAFSATDKVPSPVSLRSAPRPLRHCASTSVRSASFLTRSGRRCNSDSLACCLLLRVTFMREGHLHPALSRQSGGASRKLLTVGQENFALLRQSWNADKTMSLVGHPGSAH